jgi:hypothetical protein
MNSGDKLLVEGTHDMFWASGLDQRNTACTNPTYYPGKNKLGEILMELRLSKRTELEKKIKTKTSQEFSTFTSKVHRTNSLPNIHETVESSPYFNKKRLLDTTPEKQQKEKVVKLK